MTLLAVAMLPMTVFAKEKLADPVVAGWGKNEPSETFPEGAVWAFWDRVEHADGYQLKLYEDGNKY